MVQMRLSSCGQILKLGIQFLSSGGSNITIEFGNQVPIGIDSIETAKNLKNFLLSLQSFGFNSFLMPGAATDYENLRF